MERWRPAYVGLGSNLEDPERQVSRAFAALATIGQTRLEAQSPLYRSRPLGPADQPDYINAAAALGTRLDPAALLAALQAIEDDHGRRRTTRRWGPRTLDLDLLVYDDVVSEAPGLTLPHPGLTARNFVVYPLADIVPALVLPDGTRLLDLKARLGDEGLERLT